MTFWFYPKWQFVRPLEEAWYERGIIKEFKTRYPNVNIRYEQIPWQGALERFNLAVASNTTPDIIWMGAMNLYSWAKRGLLVDFNDMLSEYEKNDIPDWVLKRCSVNGKIAVLPYGLSPSCMAVNLDIARAAKKVHLLHPLQMRISKKLY